MPPKLPMGKPRYALYQRGNSLILIVFCSTCIVTRWDDVSLQHFPLEVLNAVLEAFSESYEALADCLDARATSVDGENRATTHFVHALLRRLGCIKEST